MFDNIGGKIKNLASVIAWIGIIASCISGLVMMFTIDGGFFVGLVSAGVGSLFSWIGSFFMYALGQLVENSDEILYQLKKTSNSNNTSNYVNSNVGGASANSGTVGKKAFFEQKDPNTKVVCPHCKFTQKGDNDYCSNCGAKFIYRSDF